MTLQNGDSMSKDILKCTLWRTKFFLVDSLSLRLILNQRSMREWKSYRIAKLEYTVNNQALPCILFVLAPWYFCVAGIQSTKLNLSQMKKPALKRLILRLTPKGKRHILPRNFFVIIRLDLIPHISHI